MQELLNSAIVFHIQKIFAAVNTCKHTHILVRDLILAGNPSFSSQHMLNDREASHVKF